MLGVVWVHVGDRLMAGIVMNSLSVLLRVNYPHLETCWKCWYVNSVKEKWSLFLIFKVFVEAERNPNYW